MADPFGGAGRPVPPNPTNRIVEFKGDPGVFALIQILAGGDFYNGTPTLVDADNAPVGSSISISSTSTTRYSRSETFVDADHTHDQVAVYTQFAGEDALDGHFSVDLVQSGVLVAPNLKASAASGGGIVSDLIIFEAANTAGIAARFTIVNVAGHGRKNAFTTRALSLGAVYLLDNPETFSISCAGFPMFLDIFLYPRGALDVDPSNRTRGQGGGVADGKVWFPLGWKTAPPPYPMGPDDKEWPGYNVVVPSPLQDVVNTVKFRMTYKVDGSERIYGFKVSREPHLLTPPEKPTPGVSDKIWEIYPRDVKAATDKWSVLSYTQVSFGRSAAGPGSWKNRTTPGPLPLI